MAAAKVYAPKQRAVEAPVHEFTMIFVRDSNEERHEFVARPRMAWQDMRGLLPLAGGADAMDHKSLAAIDRLVRRCLANDDGTPELWKPNVADGHFTAPDGDHQPESVLPAYIAFDAGSSRRRWTQLMEHDDDVTIEAEQILELMTDLVEVASGDRPTGRSALSLR